MFSTRLQYFLCSCIATVALAGGCDNSFSPKAPFTPRLVVFAVLDASSSTQIVRVEQNYDAPIGGTQPIADHTVAAARVTITDNKRVYTLSDTLLPLPEGGMRRVWITRTLQPRVDESYRLDVSVPGFAPVWSQLTLPSRMYVAADYIKPDTGVGTVRVRAALSEYKTPPSGWYYRLFVVLRKPVNGVLTEVRREVPVSSAGDVEIHTSPSRSETASFPRGMIERTHNLLIAGDTGVVNKQLLVIVHAMENNFYGYYKLVRGFDDPVSLRLDAPDLSYINGGLGVFGGFVTDSLRYTYNSLLRIKQ